MTRSTAAVLIVAAALAAGLMLLRRDAPVTERPRATREQPEVAPTPPTAKPTEATLPEVKAPEVRAAPAVVAPEPPKPGLVRGRVKVSGAVPRRKPIRMDYDPSCLALQQGPVFPDTVVLDLESHARWAFVTVKDGLKGRTFEAPATPVKLVQAGCRYEPHLLGIQAGQPLIIVNQDPLLHNIHALPFVNRAFNVGQPTRGLEETKTFAHPEMVPVRCDIHPWMSAWIGVVEHPYYSVTDPGGRYALPELPPGHYLIEAWHEACEPVTREIDVTAGDAIDLDFVLDVRT